MEVNTMLDFKRFKDCPDCSGTGYDFSDGGQCDTCDGTGEPVERFAND
jgi:DnaJ-class molecular chaperone